MMPGRAYEIYTDSNVVLKYNNKSGSNNLNYYATSPVHFINHANCTGNNSVLILQSDDFKNGDEVAILNNSQMLIGSGVIKNKTAIFTVWGDDPFTPYITEGALEGEHLMAILWSQSENAEYKLDITNVQNYINRSPMGNSILYHKDSIYVATATKKTINSVPDNYGIENAELYVDLYPLPCDNELNIEVKNNQENDISLYIYDCYGNILLGDIKLSTKQSDIKKLIDISGLASGIYYLRVNSGNSRIMKQFIVVK